MMAHERKLANTGLALMVGGAEVNERVGGDDPVDALVVVSSGELRFSELVGKNHRIHRRGRALVLQRAVVPATTLAKTIPAGVDRERRCEHEVGLRQRFFR